MDLKRLKKLSALKAGEHVIVAACAVTLGADDSVFKRWS
jgi:hypothetical protein